MVANVTNAAVSPDTSPDFPYPYYAAEENTTEIQNETALEIAEYSEPLAEIQENFYYKCQS